MSIHGFDQLYQYADSLSEPARVVAAGGADASVLEAMRLALDRGWIVPVVTGRVPEIRRVADQQDIDLNGFSLIDADRPASAAVQIVRSGRARMLMKGQLPTSELMQAVLDRKAGLRTERTICQMVLMEILSAQRRFLLADTGICIQPTLEQKIDILRSAVELAQNLGTGQPRVALMAATERPVASMPETLEAAELQRRSEAGDFPGCVVSGPLSFDLAYTVEAAEKKGLSGSIVGAADVMLFPNLLSANLTVKAIMYTADCRFGGVLCGTSCPVVFMSRADTAETRLNSLALALRRL